MKYEEPKFINMENLRKDLSSSSLDVKINALLALFMHDVDMDLAMFWLEKCLRDKNTEILRIGILGISHVARSYPFVDINHLRELLNNVQGINYKEYLNEAYSDLEIYEKTRENPHETFK